MNAEKTLKRIAYSGSLEVTIEVLQALQKAFLFSVPFENLDIHANIPITLEPDRFYNKIVMNRRGGFCYECNTLFYQLLLRLGFDVHIVAARMTLRETSSPGYSHMALLVTLDQAYLVDVGNGQSVHEPMPVPGDGVSVAEGIAYRVGRFNDAEYALYFQKPGTDWSPRFVFSTTARRLEEFSEMCAYHQTSPESVFTKQRLCTLPTQNGRITLTGNVLSTIENGKETSCTFDSEQQIDACLLQYFGFRLPFTNSSQDRH